MKPAPVRPSFPALFATAFAISLSMFAGCEKKTATPEDGEEKRTNLCVDYETCDQCIAGQQAKGVDQGSAESECGAAVLGCWTTWEKPIVCGGKEMKNEEEEAE